MKMPWGKHAGKRIDELLDNHLRWLWTRSGLPPELRDAVNQELRFRIMDGSLTLPFGKASGQNVRSLSDDDLRWWLTLQPLLTAISEEMRRRGLEVPNDGSL